MMRSCLNVVLRVQYSTAPVIQSLGKSKKKLSKMGAMVEKKVHPVETDVTKLSSLVCGSNILKEDGKDVELKSDSEYPEWLWTIRTGKPLKLEEMDVESKKYWLKVRKLSMVKHKKLKKLSRF